MTPEHAQARVGKVTASRVHDIIATTKSGGFTAGRKNYLAELVAERLTGTPAPSYQSAAMAYGIECEAEARVAYVRQSSSMIEVVKVEEVGFVPHPTIKDAGCSPDGMVGKDGLIEIKCPNTATHIDTLLRGVIPVEYISQMQWQMACTGRAWCDYVSYDRRLPEHMRLWVHRVPVDPKIVKGMEALAVAFMDELADTVALLQERFPAPAEAA